MGHSSNCTNQGTLPTAGRVEPEIPGGANGDCTYSEKRIRVEVTNAPAQRVKTLAHELAHALLHENFKDRALAELEAESTAFIVCNVLVFCV
ncbi:MAG: ImmA/IrrE family metallo-endopeptidase [Actinomycetota bacterium]|nr:ImmA/IrrE family metallo-endopeptidase [Actinomycetota bacterium]